MKRRQCIAPLGGFAAKGRKVIEPADRRSWSGVGARAEVYGAGFRTSSGSLAMFAAIRRASSLLSILAADLRPGSSS
jgi:hypothetical protein